MRVILNRPLRIGAAVKIEPDDVMILGEVCYCQPCARGFLVGFKLNQALGNLDELAKLNRRLLGEEPRETIEQPPGTPSGTPSGKPSNAWIAGRSRR